MRFKRTVCMCVRVAHWHVALPQMARTDTLEGRACWCNWAAPPQCLVWRTPRSPSVVSTSRATGCLLHQVGLPQQGLLRMRVCEWLAVR